MFDEPHNIAKAAAKKHGKYKLATIQVPSLRPKDHGWRSKEIIVCQCGYTCNDNKPASWMAHVVFLISQELIDEAEERIQELGGEI